MPRGSAIAKSNDTSKARNLRSLLSGRPLDRENSDDELGREDYQWEWLYGDDPQEGHIIEGALHGSGFRCRIGDCVLLKAEGERKAWVGLICEFLAEEEDGEKMANFMWFSTEGEIRNKVKKRNDFLANELYITPAWDVNPLNSINGTARVFSVDEFKANYPEGRVSKRDSEKTFVCRRACNTRTATYSDEFKWEEVCQVGDGVDGLIDLVKSRTKSTKRQRHNTDEDWSQVPEGSKMSSTPRKRQKTSDSILRVQSNWKPQTILTNPSSKRVVVKKPLEITPIGTRIVSSSVTSSPFQQARNRLHVSAIPMALPCREDAFAAVYSQLEAAISDGAGSCIYISGTPGTGKTATVREVVMQLNAAVRTEELDDFIFVEINGMKITDPYQSYSLLWEALRGDRVSPLHAMDLLEREFSSPSPRRVPCVVLMDELDQLVTKNQSVMYNFFNWPGLSHSRLIVLAVANTMDLPERTLSNKISSRLGLTRITFPGYTHEQLMIIIQSRLEGVSGDIVDRDAIQFASRKVAAVSGDARRALDICRRAVEIAEAEGGESTLTETPSRKDTTTTSHTVNVRGSGRVSIATIKHAINEATSSPLQHYLRSLPLASKVLLTSCMARSRRSGVSEGMLGDIIEEAARSTRLPRGLLKGDILLSPAARTHQAFVKASPGPRVRLRTLGLGLATTELNEAGIIGLEMRRGERSAKLRLLVSEDELKLAFSDDEEVHNLSLC